MSVTKRDYYEVLGVARGSDDSAIKSAYRKLALQHHPDRNPGDHSAEEKFKEAAEAYSVLSDGQKRAAYDRFGHQGVTGASGNGGFDPNGFPDLGDIINDMFGGGFEGFGGGRQQRRNRVQKGDDLRYDLEITFEDSMRGTTVDLQIPRFEECVRCKGKGAEPEDGLTSCPTCKGRGEVIFQQAFLQVRRTCGQCNGRGQIIRRPCKECRGEGHLRKEKKLKVSIPAGVDNGTQMRLSQEGQPGANGGPPGDLFVVLRVTEHPVFERHEYDLHCSLPVNLAQAALGATVELMTFDGMKDVKIPEGSQPGARIRLKNMGVPHVNSSSRGDLLVHLAVKVPTKLSKDQRRLMEQLRDLLPTENAPEEKSILEKVKDYFM